MIIILWQAIHFGQFAQFGHSFFKCAYLFIVELASLDLKNNSLIFLLLRHRTEQHSVNTCYSTLCIQASTPEHWTTLNIEQWTLNNTLLNFGWWALSVEWWTLNINFQHLKLGNWHPDINWVLNIEHWTTFNTILKFPQNTFWTAFNK